MDRFDLLHALHMVYRGNDEHEHYYKLKEFILQQTANENKVPVLLKRPVEEKEQT